MHFSRIRFALTQVYSIRYLILLVSLELSNLIFFVDVTSLLN
jgi:hypothetical protein